MERDLVKIDSMKQIDFIADL